MVRREKEEEVEEEEKEETEEVVVVEEEEGRKRRISRYKVWVGPGDPRPSVQTQPQSGPLICFHT